MDLAVYRPSTGQWLILQSSTNYTTSQTVTFGATTDIVVERGNRVLQPIIASLSPSSGLAAQSVTITGTNFGSAQGNSTVTFAGVGG